MSGPPYPLPSPGAGSAIGDFVIGVSAIGEIELFDFWASVISQYANSPVLTAMIESFNDAVDQTQDLNDFYDMMWNILTAQGYGLDVWGRIVGVNRSIQLPSTAGTFVGFQETGDPSHDIGFGGGTPTPNAAPFYTGAGISNTVTLDDADFRTLIFAKALSNICGGGIPQINQVLLTLFPGRGNCFVTEVFTPATISRVAGQVASTGPSGTTATLTLPSNPTAGNTVVVGIGTSSAVLSVRDSAGNNYIRTPNSGTSGAFGAWLFYLPNAPSTATGTITITVATSSGISAWAQEYAGVGGFQIDAIDINPTGGTVNGPTITPPVNGCLVIAALQVDQTLTGAGTGWTEVGIVERGNIAEDMIQGTATAATVVATPTSGIGPGFAAVAAVFTPAETQTVMEMTYTFQFTLSATELAIVEFGGVLPRPAGVLTSVVHP